MKEILLHVGSLSLVLSLEGTWEQVATSQSILGEVLLANGRGGQRVRSCMLGVGVQIYRCVRSVFAGLAFGVLRRLQTGSI